MENLARKTPPCKSGQRNSLVFLFALLPSHVDFKFMHELILIFLSLWQYVSFILSNNLRFSFWERLSKNLLNGLFKWNLCWWCIWRDTWKNSKRKTSWKRYFLQMHAVFFYIWINMKWKPNFVVALWHFPFQSFQKPFMACKYVVHHSSDGIMVMKKFSISTWTFFCVVLAWDFMLYRLDWGNSKGLNTNVILVTFKFVYGYRSLAFVGFHNP